MVEQGSIKNVSALDLSISYVAYTGSMVFTITGSFYRNRIQPLGQSLKPTCHLQLKGVNGLAIPYVGYITPYLT